MSKNTSNSLAPLVPVWLLIVVLPKLDENILLAALNDQISEFFKLIKIFSAGIWPGVKHL